MNNDTSLALLVMLAAAVGIVTLICIIPAPASTVCLTRKEARQLWPRQHIYWYSKDHCWSNRRGPPRNLKFDPVFSHHAEDKKLPVPDEDKKLPIPKAEAPLRSDQPLRITTDGCCWPVLTEFDLRWAGMPK